MLDSKGEYFSQGDEILAEFPPRVEFPPRSAQESPSVQETEKLFPLGAIDSDTVREPLSAVQTKRALTKNLPSSGSANSSLDAEPVAEYASVGSTGSLGQLSELRRDVLTGSQTIFACNRAERPLELVPVSRGRGELGPCPFCAGNEHLTPETLLEIPGEDSANWAVRVVTNKYPAVAFSPGCGDMGHNQRNPQSLAKDRVVSSRTAERFGIPAWGSPPARSKAGRRNLFPRAEIAGGHEVIIESPDHLRSISQLHVHQIANIFKAISSRVKFWKSVPEIQYISAFKNVGAAAGASLSHAHSQLIATAALPPAIHDVVFRSTRHFDLTGCCLQCDLIRAEEATGSRVVLSTKHFVAYCPFASQLPFLVRVVPREHADCLEDASAEQFEELAHLSRRIVECYEELFADVAYNCVIHTRPPGVRDDSVFHWSIDWMPRITTQAGFEFASDCFINPTLPEAAAQQLRDVVDRLNPLRVNPARNVFSSP